MQRGIQWEQHIRDDNKIYTIKNVKILLLKQLRKSSNSSTTSVLSNIFWTITGMTYCVNTSIKVHKTGQLIDKRNSFYNSHFTIIKYSKAIQKKLKNKGY